MINDIKMVIMICEWTNLIEMVYLLVNAYELLFSFCHRLLQKMNPEYTYGILESPNFLSKSFLDIHTGNRVFYYCGSFYLKSFLCLLTLLLFLSRKETKLFLFSFYWFIVNSTFEFMSLTVSVPPKRNGSI